MLNSHFKKLKTAYIFPIIEKKLAELEKEHPNQKVYNLGIGDVSLPLAPKVADAICAATREMTDKPRGYGPCGGYDFLKKAIQKHEYPQFELDEIFISDGANTDASSIQELFQEKSSVVITDPTYPVYRDACLIGGKELITIPLLESEAFIPRPPTEGADLAYLCTPCNPTGVAMNRNDLAEWITWAKKHSAVLVLDNVYNAFVSSEAIPSSIYELEGAREVAIEIRSFSKRAGFTGLRCGYMVIPKELGEINTLWQKRIDIKTNGVSFPIQKGAAACFEEEVKKQLDEQLSVYKSSAKILRDALCELGQTFYGGENAPYIWWKTPDGLDSWAFFDELLTRSKILGIPGSGFGPAGEGYLRLSCFISNPLATEAADALHHHFAAV